MCRGGLISLGVLAAAIALVACVDADNTTPTTTAPPLPAMTGGGSTAPRGGAGGASVTPSPGVAGMTASPPPVSTGGMPSTPVAAAGASAPSAGGTGGSGGVGGASGGMGGSRAGAGGMMATSGSGGASGGAGGAAGGGAATGPKFSEVYPILMMRCAACHGAAGGVMLATKDAAYTSLMGMGAAGMCMGMKRVVAGNPDMSVLIQAVKGTGCRMGRPMPPGGAMLSADDVKKLSDWIMAGAKND